MASASSICALVVHWRFEIPPGGAEQNGIDINGPKWLTGINAAQLAAALIYNIFLLINMAQRVRVSIAQPVTIIGWYLSSLVLNGRSIYVHLFPQIDRPEKLASIVQAGHETYKYCFSILYLISIAFVSAAIIVLLFLRTWKVM
jgi:hypothetical protein